MLMSAILQAVYKLNSYILCRHKICLQIKKRLPASMLPCSPIASQPSSVYWKLSPGSSDVDIVLDSMEHINADLLLH